VNVEGMVKQLEQSGVCFLLNGDRVRLRAPAGGRLPPDMVQALRLEKTAVLEFLRERADKSLERDIKQFRRDPFWQAARPAGRQIEKLPHLAEAMAYLRDYHPEFYRLLTEDWLEEIRNLWEAGKLREFEKALRVWVMMHAELCKAYQRFGLLER
jgi:hypothetical protein